MSWQTEMTTLLRVFINDDVTPYEYGDDRLQNLIVSSAQLTLGVVDFPRDYTVDIEGTGITPDPTSATKDNGFINLVTLKAACLVATGDYRSASNKAISVKDGPSTIDAKGIAEHKKGVMQDWCKAFADALLQFRLGNSNAGEAIVGPHRSDATNRTTLGDRRTRPDFN